MVVALYAASRPSDPVPTAEPEGPEFQDQTVSETVMVSARWIVTNSVQVGNLLRSAANGTDSGRDDLRLMEYTWDQASLSVTSPALRSAT